MNDLPEAAVASHGGLDRWNQVKSITVGAPVTGAPCYLTGEALWTYLNTPFLHTWPGLATEEIAPIEAGGQTWRRLKATFPDHIKSHARQQISVLRPGRAAAPP